MKKFLEKVPGWLKFALVIGIAVHSLWAGFIILMSNIYNDWPPVWFWFLPLILASIVGGLIALLTWAGDRWL